MIYIYIYIDRQTDRQTGGALNSQGGTRSRSPQLCDCVCINYPFSANVKPQITLQYIESLNKTSAYSVYLSVNSKNAPYGDVYVNIDTCGV